MNNSVLAVILALGSSVPGATQVPLTNDFEIAREARQLAFVNTVPPGERTYSKGDLILDVPLVWEYAAKVVDPVTITAGPDSVTLAPGTILQAVMLKRGDAPRSIQAFCTPRVAGERKADKGFLGAMLGGGSLWRGILRGATDKQYCLLDGDDDGVADQSVLIYAGTEAMRSPVAIAPVHLDRQSRIPISDRDRLQIRVNDIPQNGKSISFWLDIIQRGESRRFTSFGSTQRLTSVSFKKVVMPCPVEMVGAHFEVVASGGVDRRATIRWPGGADKEAFVAVPDGLKIVVRYGYY